MIRRGWCAFFLLSILSFPIPEASADDGRIDPPQLAGWSEDLELLATDREKVLFTSLHGDSDRQMFLQRFWQARDPYPQTSRNELREEWEGRLQQARQRWGNLKDDRSRVFLIRGEPTSRFEASCPASGTLDVWVYEPAFREKYRTVLVFLPGEEGPARLWRPGSAPDLAAAAAESCSNQEKLIQETKWIRWTGEDQYGALLERALARPRPREWVSTFRAVSLDAPPNAPRLNADLQVEFAGLQRDKVVVRVLMLVSPQALQAAAQGGQGRQGSDGLEFSVAGQVLRNGEPFETFLYRLRGRAAGGVGRGVPLAFERYLAPGDYRLRLRVEHVASGSVSVAERDLSVPQMQRAAVTPPSPAAVAPASIQTSIQTSIQVGQAPAPAPAAPGVAQALAEADAALSANRPSLRLLPPHGTLLTGSARFSVRVDQAPDTPAGERVERVAFTLDGKPLLTRANPPYDVSLDLGPVPRPRKLQAVGLGGGGEVVARDELLINAGAQDFRVRLLEPRQGRSYRQSLRVLADVTPPPGATIERVELFFGEERIATLYQPPYSHPYALSQEGETGYLRAVAFLAGGGSSEDLVFINTPIEPDKLDVHMVELYTTVIDPQGRPVTAGLEPGVFQVTENGVRQQVRQVEHVGDTPVRVVTLIDSSASMAPQMGPTRQAALGFLRNLLRPQDQAAVISFSDSPHVTVPLTGDLEQLEEGLQGVLADGDTALYDSLVYSLLYLTEAKGQRAVLLLSDGLDRASRLDLDQAMEAARRAGIAVYAIGLGFPEGARGEAGQTLDRLARVTGGQSYFVKDVSELNGVYGHIENELRAQYRIAYQSSNDSKDGAFRTVQVQVADGAMDARTISGYYP